MADSLMDLKQYQDMIVEEMKPSLIRLACEGDLPAKLEAAFSRVMDTRPSYYSGRRVQTDDLNSAMLEKLHENIMTGLGEGAAQHFVNLVATVQELSATNFLRAMRYYAHFNYTWTPETNRHQYPFCVPTQKLGDLDINKREDAEALVLQSFLGPRQNCSRGKIAGKFIEKFGTRGQLKGLQENSHVTFSKKGAAAKKGYEHG